MPAAARIGDGPPDLGIGREIAFLTAGKGFLTLAITSAVAIVFLTYLVATLPHVQYFIITSDQLTIIILVYDILKNPHFNAYIWKYSHAPYFFWTWP